MLLLNKEKWNKLSIQSRQKKKNKIKCKEKDKLINTGNATDEFK